MKQQRVLAFVDEAAFDRAASMSSAEMQFKLEAIFADQARASLHAGAHLTLAIEALPRSPAVERSRVSLRALGAQLHKWDDGLQTLAGICESMLARAQRGQNTDAATHG